jgi:hypothetical protein
VSGSAPQARVLVLAFATALVSASALVAGGCSGGGGSNDGGGTNPGTDGGINADGGQACGPAAPSYGWTFSLLDDMNAGFQPQIVLAPNGKLGIAYYRHSADMGQCVRMMNGMSSTPTPVAAWDVMYASEDTNFMPEKVTTTNLTALVGLSLAYDGSGRPNIAFMGGQPAQFWCGGANMMQATKNGAAWTISTIDTDGMATPVFMEDATNCAAIQNYCNTAGPGEGVVGLWPALGYINGAAILLYQDFHYGFAMDDFTRADIELSWNGRFTLDATWGGGTFTRLVIDGMQHPWVVHFNPNATRYGMGIYLLHHDGMTWSRQKISGELKAGYTLGFANTGTRFGLAYYSKDKERLFYLESADGTTWPADSEVIDQDGNTGQSPALAFDPSGNPSVSYYRCGDYVPGSNDCMSGADGLHFAVKACDGWHASVVKAERTRSDGVNTALVYDSGGLPAIAYQATSLDPTTNMVIRELRLARGMKH